MKARITHIKRIALLLVVAAVAVPAAQAGIEETQQIATFLSASLPGQPSGNASGAAEAKQIAAFLSGSQADTVPTAAESGRAEAEQIAAYLNGSQGNPVPTAAQSGRAEAKQIASFLSTGTQPLTTGAQSGRAEAQAFANYLRSSAPSQVAAVHTDGFDWGDAAVGAGFAGGLALLAGALALGLLRRRVPAH